MHPRTASVLATSIVSALILGSAWAMAQDGNGTSAGNETTPGPEPGGNQTGGPTPGFTHDGAALSGAHVAFRYDASTGTVCDWSLNGTVVIESIAWSGFAGDIEVQGSLATVEGGSAGGVPSNGSAGNTTGSACPDARPAPRPGSGGQAPGDGNGTGGTDGAAGGNGTGAGAHSRLALHDLPTGFVKARLGSEQTIEWTFSPNVTVSAHGPDKVHVRGATVQAVLWLDAPDQATGLSVAGDRVTWTSTSDGSLRFRVAPQAEPDDAAIHDAVVAGGVAAEISILGAEDHVVADYDNVTLSNVEIETTKILVDLDVAIEAGADGAPPPSRPPGSTPPPADNNTSQGGGAGSGGNTSEPADTTAPPVTVVVLDLDVTQINASQDVTIHIDGAAVELALDVSDVLTHDEGRSEAFVLVEDEGKARVLASVPTGRHNISVASASAAPIVDEAHTTGDELPGPGELPGRPDGGDLPGFPPPETGPAPGPEGDAPTQDQDTPAVGAAVAIALLVALLAWRRPR